VVENYYRTLPRQHLHQFPKNEVGSSYVQLAGVIFPMAINTKEHYAIFGEDVKRVCLIFLNASVFKDMNCGKSFFSYANWFN